MRRRQTAGRCIRPAAVRQARVSPQRFLRLDEDEAVEVLHPVRPERETAVRKPCDSALQGPEELLPTLGQGTRGPDDHLLQQPRVRKGGHVGVRVLAELNARNVEVRDDLLHGLVGASRRGAQAQDAESGCVAPVRAEVRHEPGRRVPADSAVALIHHQAHHLRRGQKPMANVVLHGLWGRKEHPAVLVPQCPVLGLGGTRDFGRVRRGDAHDAVARLHLLVNEGLGRGNEDDLTAGEPSVEVVHHDGRDERLPEARGQAHQGVAQESPRANRELVVPPRWTLGVDPVRRGGFVDPYPSFRFCRNWVPGGALARPRPPTGGGGEHACTRRPRHGGGRSTAPERLKSALRHAVGGPGVQQPHLALHGGREDGRGGRRPTRTRGQLPPPLGESHPPHSI